MENKKNSNDDTIAKWFQWVGYVEGISFLFLLGVAMPLKYFANMPKAVSITGMVHGVLFLAYCYLAFDCYQRMRWPFGRFVLAIIAAFFPFGPFVFHRKFLSSTDN